MKQLHQNPGKAGMVSALSPSRTSMPFSPFLVSVIVVVGLGGLRSILANSMPSGLSDMVSPICPSIQLLSCKSMPAKVGFE